jgi:transketolase
MRSKSAAISTLIDAATAPTSATLLRCSLDLNSVKPVDTQTLLDAAATTGDRVVVVEDHYPAGGIGSAVPEALNDAGPPVQICHLAVRGLPGSGTPAELMRAAGISADHVVEAARRVLAA